MSENNAQVTISTEDARRVFNFLEKAHDLMHQPLKYKDAEEVENFVSKNYAEVRELYYQIVWNWLPNHDQAAIEQQ